MTTTTTTARTGDEQDEAEEECPHAVSKVRQAWAIDHPFFRSVKAQTWHTYRFSVLVNHVVVL
jgi:hypothetical protein